MAFLAGLVALWLASLPALPAPADETRAALLTVRSYDAKGKLLRHSPGLFLTGEGHFLAPRDVFAGAARAEVRDASGKVHNVKGLLAESVSNGLARAVIDPPQGGTPFAAVADAPPEARDLIRLAATGAEVPVFAVRDIPALGKVLRIPLRLPRDAEASPVLNAKGEVAGVVLWQDSSGTSFVAAGDFLLHLAPGPLKPLAEWRWERNAEVESEYRAGLTRLFLDDYDGALAHFNRALAQDAKFAEAWFHGGFVEGKQGRQERKMEGYKEAIRLKPAYAGARYSLGVSYALMGRGDLALEQYRALKPLNEVLAERLEFLIDSMIHQGHQDPSPPPQPPPAKT